VPPGIPKLNPKTSDCTDFPPRPVLRRISERVTAGKRPDVVPPSLTTPPNRIAISLASTCLSWINDETILGSAAEGVLSVSVIGGRGGGADV